MLKTIYSILFIFILTACQSTTTVINEPQSLDKSFAFFQLTSDHKLYDQENRLGIQLTRYNNAGRIIENVNLGLVEKNKLQVLELEPGYYFLTKSSSKKMQWEENYGLDSITFTVYPSSATYVGDWHLDAIVSDYKDTTTVEGGVEKWSSNRMRSIRYRLNPHKTINNKTIMSFAKQYPKLITSHKLTGDLPDKFIKKYIASPELLTGDVDQTKIYNDDELDVYAEEVYRKKPIYPTDALSKDLSGYVEMSVVININGKVDEANIIDEFPKNVFNESALAAIQNWKFKPALIADIPVKSKITIFLEWEIPADNT